VKRAHWLPSHRACESRGHQCNNAAVPATDRDEEMLREPQDFIKSILGQTTLEMELEASLAFTRSVFLNTLRVG